jgi:hypothetical protein
MLSAHTLAASDRGYTPAQGTYLVDLNRDEKIVVLQVNLVRLPDKPSNHLDNRIPLHRIVIPHVGPHGKLH